MAEFQPAIQKTLANEGGFFSNPRTGEVVNMGITHWLLRSIGKLPTAERSTPATAQEIDFVKNLQRSDAVEIYKTRFWDSNRFGELTSQALAEKVFDLSVNTGRGVEFLQQGINRILWPSGVSVDNKMGPATLAATNRLDQAELLAEVKAAATKYYTELAAKNPLHLGDLSGWLARLQKP